MRTSLFWVALLVTMMMGVDSLSAQGLVLTSIEHTVVPGDTIDTIAQFYLPPSWGESFQAFEEFREGIYEYNFDKVFFDRKPYEVREGDSLVILFWQ